MIAALLKSKINNLIAKLNNRYILREEIAINYFEKKSLLSTSTLVSDANENTNIIVSLTTYSIRINDVHLVIESLGEQTIKPDRIILWLDDAEFSENSIPEVLKRQIHRGLEIRFCRNYRSYKKLIPILEMNLSKDIITVDDDVIYPYDFIEIFKIEAEANPRIVLCNHAHKMVLDKFGKIAPYKDWDNSTDSVEASSLIFPVGVGGVYYPNGCFSEKVLESELFMSLAPTADDVWFKAMTLKNGVKSKKVNDSRAYLERFIPISRGQSIALFHQNVDEGLNDGQIKKVFSNIGLDCLN
ncbi:glycosyltransferase family 2 protein [Photobacterium sp. ZSDE20]|nr:glycosyltransferase family 2 protein [Photobacterium sp. ZSDE20]